MDDDISDKIAKLKKEARAENIPAMLDDGIEILLKTVKEIKPQRILEIGTAIGYSGMAMLYYAPQSCVLDTLEIDNERYKAALKNFAEAGLSQSVNCYLGDSAVELPAIIGDKKYDMVFIDAAKSKYLDCLISVENNISDGGVVVADNVYFRGMVTDKEEPPRKYRAIVKNLRKFIDYISDNNKFDTVIYDKGDGVAVIKKQNKTIKLNNTVN